VLQALLTSYNIGVDPDQRNKRMVEATARRVGFELPKTLGRNQALGSAEEDGTAVAAADSDMKETKGL
jgi:hypothetical protein